MTTRARETSSSKIDRATDWARDVVTGKVIAGPHIRNACRRHLDDLDDGPARGLTWDLAAAQRAIRFFEEKLRLSEGQFENRAFLLHPSQAFKIGCLFGWKWKDGFRRFQRAYIEEGKGNGKSPLAGGIGLYGLTADKEAGAQIYAAAATKDQANILFRDAVNMVDKSPDLDKRLKRSGGPGNEYNLAYLRNKSFFRPISREAKKTGSGPRPHMALCDEVHEHPDRGTIEMLERGFKFRQQPLLFMITNSGSDRKSVAREEHDHAIRVAAGNRDAKDDDPTYLGEPLDDRTFSFVCSLDKGDDPLNDPSCWIKANPLLGVTITEDYLAGVVKQAKDMPSKLNGILRLHFCVWTDADTAWMTRDLLEPCLAKFDPLALHRGKRVGLGLDLSQTRDLTALGAAVETGFVEEGEHAGKPTVDAWVEVWTPGDTLASRVLRDKQPYDLWARDGFLHAPAGAVISYRHVAQAVAEYDHNYRILALGYDRYAFKKFFEPELNELGLSIPQVEHPQGGTKKGKPTEAMIAAAKAAETEPEGLWMPASVKLFETMVLERRIRLFGNPVLISAIMSAVTDKDRWENYWLSKDKATNKIDAAIAVVMAVGVLMSVPPETGLDEWLAAMKAMKS